MALPMPCNARNKISKVPEGESAHRMELTAIMILPIKKIFFLPLISASLPRGTRKTADERRKAMETQLIPTAPRLNSSLIDGRAILIAAPRKGLIKEVMIMAKRISFLLELLRSVIFAMQSKEGLNI